MKKYCFLSFIMVIISIISTGCATNYFGRTNRFTPIDQQCFITFHSDIKITAIDGKKVNLGVGTLRADQGINAVYIPAGRQTLTMYYQNVSIYYSGDTTTEKISTSDAMDVTYDFQPGKEYNIRYSRSQNRINVEIVEIDHQNSKNGIYSGWDQHFLNCGFSTTPFGYFDFELGTKRGFVFDPGISLGLYIDLGVAIGVGYPWVFTGGFFAGGMFETYFTSKVGLAVGGGYRIDFGMHDGESIADIIYGPYIRGGLKIGRDMLIYGDFYFQELFDKESYIHFNMEPYPYRNWGVGIKWSI